LCGTVLKDFRGPADRVAMRHLGSRRRQRRLDRLAMWLEEFWSCACNYHNIASVRCYGCGAKPPRHVCTRVAAKPIVEVSARIPVDA
jgi:hypothetical protein